jgi:hypothetical protein
MGQLDRPPRRVGEIGTFRAGGFSLEKAPSVIEGEAALAGDWDGGGGGEG